MLSPTALSGFNLRDRNSIAKIFPTTSRNWGSGIWLGKNNRYVRNDKLVATDLRNPPSIQHKHLREYVAASVLVHTIDGWSYLSRAINAQLVGDHDSSRHLGYYAELRAAMAILAANGVGVFNREHVSVDSNLDCQRIASGGGTHEFVWNSLETWAATAEAKNVVLKTIKAGGVQLNEWITHFSPGSTLARTTARGLLMDWGMDIGKLYLDREARNFSSYRPTLFTSPRPIGVGSTIGFVSRLWQLCEPIGTEKFSFLDRDIVRSTIRRIGRIDNLTTAAERQVFERKIDSLLVTLNPAQIPNQGWKGFLLDGAAADASFPSIARKTDGPSSPEHSVQVATRALLLLRLATSESSEVIQAVPGAKKAHLQAMIALMGEDRGIWAPGKMPTPITDLWEDSFDAISALEGDKANINSYFDLWSRQSAKASILCGCERAAIWGMCG